MYNNNTVKLALNASSNAFGVRASTEMWMLLFFVSVYAIFGKLISHLGEMSTEKNKPLAMRVVRKAYPYE